MPQTKISRVNHYVPQAVLRRCAFDGVRVYAYRLLVSHPSVPEWEPRPIRGIAFQQDLYTEFAGGDELDALERWINEEFEGPGLAAIEKLLAGERLAKPEWVSVSKFVAAQDVRTPLNFVESMRRWQKEIPGILERSFNATSDYLKLQRDRATKTLPSKKPNEFSGLIRVHTQPSDEGDEVGSVLRAEVSLGQPLWIASMRHLLKGAADVLTERRWSVVEVSEGQEWPMTDHPVIRLNYYNPGHYDFRGGWNNPGSEIIMPLSPRLLLYTQVGERRERRFRFDSEKTQLVQRFLFERAHRWIFARQPTEMIRQLRPRVEDAVAFREDQEIWRQWRNATAPSAGQSPEWC